MRKSELFLLFLSVMILLTGIMITYQQSERNKAELKLQKSKLRIEKMTWRKMGWN